MLNPYAGGSLTPLIAPGQSGGFAHSVIGGASAYGVLDYTTMTNSAFADYILNAPTGATSMLVLLPGGIPGFDNSYAGYEMLVLVDFSGHALTGAQLMGQSLQTYGYADDPNFGGSGSSNLLASLDNGGIFATLVSSAAGASQYSFGNGSGSFGGTLNGSGVIYDIAANQLAGGTEVPEPGALALLGSGALGIAAIRRRRR